MLLVNFLDGTTERLDLEAEADMTKWVTLRSQPRLISGLFLVVNHTMHTFRLPRRFHKIKIDASLVPDKEKPGQVFAETIVVYADNIRGELRVFRSKRRKAIYTFEKVGRPVYIRGLDDAP